MKATALIVEDDRAIGELERDYLEAAGFTAYIQTDGGAALQTAKATCPENAFDLYIVDLMLPGSDGFAICRELRSHTERPIIVVSARDGDMDKVRALGLGADDYVTKPFSPAELVARAKAHIERYERLLGAAPAGESAPTAIFARDIVIDLEKKTVSVAGKFVQQ